MQTPPPPPQFRGQVPLIGQAQQKAQAAIFQMVQQISGRMWETIAIQRLSMLESHQEIDLDQFRRLARDCQLAAQAYFEGLGVATFGKSGEGQAPIREVPI